MPFNRTKFLLTLCCVSLLAACGVLPKPFAHSKENINNPLVALAGGGAIRVSVTPGLPESLSKLLADSMVKSLWAEHVPASSASTFRPRYILNGEMKIFYPSVYDPEQVEIIWTLSDAKGTKLDSFDLRVSGDRAGWLFLDKNLITDLSFDMGREVVRMLYSQRRPKTAGLKMLPDTSRPTGESPPISPDTQPVPPGDSAILSKKPKIFLAEIIGAPGDGNKSLFRNLHRSMTIAGAKLVASRPESDFLVKGFVNVSPSYNASRDVAITWLVTTKEGKELGKVTQNNKVPIGALDGRWGDMAHAIAQGGSIGIIDIVEQYLAPSDGKRRLVIP